jgi:hypothetical protein
MVVGQPVFEVALEALDRIELGGIRGKEVQADIGRRL